MALANPLAARQATYACPITITFLDPTNAGSTLCGSLNANVCNMILGCCVANGGTENTIEAAQACIAPSDAGYDAIKKCILANSGTCQST